ncbi:MAG: hypothetical protein P8X62_06160 [Flavobacteriaceae bacterium]
MKLLDINILRAYTLTYCASADFKISEKEAEYIKSKTRIDNFEQIQCEQNSSPDYKIIQKILSSINQYGYTNDEKEALFNDIEEMLQFDKNYNLLKQNTCRGLKYILK